MISKAINYLLKKIICFLVIVFITCFLQKPTLAADGSMAEWTVLVYVQAKNNLSSFAIKNFSDMATIGSNKTVNILAQWYHPGQNGVWRYKIEKDKMVLDEHINNNSDGCAVSDLVDAMQWAVKKYPAQKYALILWDHGIGIIDPVWNRPVIYNNFTNNFQGRQESFPIDSPMLLENPRIQIDGITINNEPILEENSNTIYKSRGILFNEQTRTYMDNQSLKIALDLICKIINKKLDFLGMDACLMAMLEVAYLAQNYADVLVASQEVELAHGWTYADLVHSFSKGNMSGKKIAQDIILSYEAYYKNKIPFHTQSAIDLALVMPIKNTLDKVVDLYKTCKQVDLQTISQIIKKVRTTCLHFSAQNYIDLGNFCTEFYKELDAISTGSTLYKSNLSKRLSTELKNTISYIKQAVIANTVGKNLSTAQGISIYYPQGGIDGSYLKTDFAQQCLWSFLIQDRNLP